jgi:5-methyltetrahydrofolate--homocysteine methyltransferase
VVDASRAVTVVESLLGVKKTDFVADLKAEYQRLREHHAAHRADKQLLTLAEARANALNLDFNPSTCSAPNKIGVQVYNEYPLEELLPYIDWTPFFQTWELYGKYPQILTDEVVGEEATKLFADAQEMLNRIVTEKWLTAKAVTGIFPANAVGDDIEIYPTTDDKTPIYTQRSLRQQTKKAMGQPNIALADFIAPKSSGVDDYIGGFVVTTGIGLDEHVARFEADHDDYNSILIKALADRLAEAFAERMHEVVRKDQWGYGSDEQLSNDELIKEHYRGIRPAPGYPACPDHTEKIGLFELLNATLHTSVELTENLAMTPVSSVSGWYFAHPDAKYFGLGKITEEQIRDVSDRKNVPFDEMDRWLSSVKL